LQAVISPYETDAIAGFHQDKKIGLLYSVIQELPMFTADQLRPEDRIIFYMCKPVEQ